MHRASVTKIHLCQRCPRLLAYQLRGEENAWKIGFSGTGNMPGSLFHNSIASPFFKDMSRDSEIRRKFVEVLEAPRHQWESRAMALLQSEVFLPAMRENAAKLKGDQGMQLAQGFEQWCKVLINFLDRALTGDARDIPRFLGATFHLPEQSLHADGDAGHGRLLRVSGRYDCLLFDPKSREAVLMEFKGRKASYADEDFVQVLLYCWLIKNANGITPRAVVLYLEEEDPQAAYPVAKIDQAMQNLPGLFGKVLDVLDLVNGRKALALAAAPDRQLCTICPFDKRCDRDWGPRPGAAQTPPEPKAPEGERPIRAEEQAERGAEQEAKRSMDALVAALSALRSPVEPDGYIAGPRFMRLKVKPDVARKVTVRKLCNLAQDLQVQLNLQTPPLIQPQAGHISVDIPRKTRIPLTLGEVWRRGQQNRPDSKAAFPIGMAIDGSVVWADLSDPTMTSMLVGGTAGSGKSVFLRSAVIGMALNAGPQDIQFTLIDPKRVSFTDLTALPHLSGKVLMDNEPALERLGELIEEMERRYRVFEQEKTADIKGYNRVGGKLSHHVVLIDEYADLIIDKETKDELELAVRRLGQKGRAAGIHLILATQRPDAKVVTPLIKANLQLKVALKATTGVNSKVILDETGAECLIGHGDMLIGGSVPVQRLQGPLVTKDEIQRAARSGA